MSSCYLSSRWWRCAPLGAAPALPFLAFSLASRSRDSPLLPRQRRTFAGAGQKCVYRWRNGIWVCSFAYPCPAGKYQESTSHRSETCKVRRQSLSRSASFFTSTFSPSNVPLSFELGLPQFSWLLLLLLLLLLLVWVGADPTKYRATYECGHACTHPEPAHTHTCTPTGSNICKRRPEVCWLCFDHHGRYHGSVSGGDVPGHCEHQVHSIQLCRCGD